MFSIGDKVKIKSKFGGIYDKLTGVVVENNTDKWYIRVEFDNPVIICNEKTITQEIFYPSELSKFEV